MPELRPGSLANPPAANLRRGMITRGLRGGVSLQVAAEPPEMDMEDEDSSPEDAVAVDASTEQPVDPQAVDPTGGRFSAGLIRGAAVVTRGEALGWEMWLDDVFLASVADAINAAGDRGIKGRFTHPNSCNDGLGSYLGRWSNATLDGDIVRADLHVNEVAHSAPEGDIGAYVLELAAQDPEAFGASIVFRWDDVAEELFQSQNTRVDPTTGELTFVSPDPDNVESLPHARLQKLWAIDCVDEPAANPQGMLSANQPAAQAEALIDYCLGAGPRPSGAPLGIDPDRARTFLAQHLTRRSLTINRHQEPTMPPQTPNSDPQTPPAPVATPATAPALSADRSEAARFFERWGEFGATSFAKGLSWDETGRAYEAHLAARVESLNSTVAERDERLAKLSAASAIGTDPVRSAGAKSDPAPSPVSRLRAALASQLKN